jgi:Tol biopolymer transport system component
MLRRDGYVKVFDFGLAKLSEPKMSQRRPTLDNADVSALSASPAISSPGTVMGTAAYMSPEQARGVTVDERTDIWSLGVVLYELVCGRAPFVGQTPMDVAVAIVEKEPTPISQSLVGAPAELERILKKALRKDRDQRYQIVKEMAIDLRGLRKDLEIESQLDRSAAPTLPDVPDAASSTSDINRNVDLHVDHLRTDDAALHNTDDDPRVDTDRLRPDRLTTVGPPPARSRSSSKWLALGALLVLLIAGAAFGIYKYVKRPEPVRARFQRMNVTKLTTNGNALFASISPDGKYVAYIKSEGGKESLWLRQVGSAGNIELQPPRDGHYQGVAFSPDGGSIYYGYTVTTGNDVGEIFKVPVLGTGAPPVKVNPEEGPSSLSHDGKRLAFLRHSRVHQSDTLVVAKADGSDEQTIVTRKWPDRFSWDWSTTPAWSNDDQYLNLPLVNSDAEGFYITIYEIKLADRSDKLFQLSPQRFEQPSHVNLLSDASALLLSARAQGASFQQIWYLGRDGSLRALTNDLSDYRDVLLTADSKSFVTTQTQTLSNIWVAPKGDAAQAKQITPGLGRYFDLSWTPDGKIAYASDASGAADIYEVAADGSNVRQLTSAMKRNYAPVVSADNRYIVVHSNRSGVFQIWRMDRDGGNPLQLTFGTSESHWPQYSTDGKFVIYQHFEAGEPSTLWRVPIDGGPPAKVTEGFAVRPAVSPDGKWLGYWFNDGKPGTPWGLALLSLETGKQVRSFSVAPTVQIGWDKILRWNSDSRSLTYVDNRGGVENLWGQPIDGGAPKQLTTFTDSFIFSFDWSREGNLVVSRGVLTSDVVLVTDADQAEARP